MSSMSKQYLIATPTTSGQAVQHDDVVATNWSICVLCQESTSERLISPANATRKHGSGYRVLDHNLKKIKKLEGISMNIKLEWLNDGSGIEQTLRTNNAVWHKSCFNKCDNLKLQRAQKRKHSDADLYGSPVKTRSAIPVPNKIPGRKACFFCNKSDTSVMHKAKTDDMGATVHQCAELVQDTALIAKLAMGDMHAQDAEYHHKCLVGLYNRARSVRKNKNKSPSETSVEGIALAELVSYLKDSRVGDVTTIFKHCDLEIGRAHV